MELPPLTQDRNANLRARAAALETAFVSQMLAHAGLDRALSGMGGGPGADQFASFLREEQAAAIVRSGGLGMSESLFRAMGGSDD